ncbi:hypothetical protein SM793_11505 [Kitasatospora purpeofusca]|nr:hypothetical protein [Kitasatospora purpeofusca]MDY0812030.1 hypothetical protein [Kitasatospora purpeofusca]
MRAQPRLVPGKVERLEQGAGQEHLALAVERRALGEGGEQFIASVDPGGASLARPGPSS